MKRLALSICVMTSLLGYSASAQLPNNLPGGSRFNPPPPPPPPPPKIEVPVVPKFDAPARPDYRPLPRSSFGDRVVRCLDDAAAAGLAPADRAAYARACANQ